MINLIASAITVLLNLVRLVKETAELISKKISKAKG